MGAYVGKFIDAYTAPLPAGPKGFSNLRVMSVHRPCAARPLAVQDQVHWTTNAHRPLELASASPKVTAMLHAAKVGAEGRREKGELHDSCISRTIR